MPEPVSFEEQVALFQATADSAKAHEEWATSRAEVIMPLLEEQSTVRPIFRYMRLAPGAQARFDIPHEDVECVWMLPQVGTTPTIQMETTSIMVDTFGLMGGVEYQEDVAREGRVDMAQMVTRRLKNNFLIQEELAGWSLIKAHAAMLGGEQIIDGRNDDGGTTGQKKLNIHTINETITTGDTLGQGGRRVTNIYCSPRRFGDLRSAVTMAGLPDDLKMAVWNNGKGSDNVAELKFHKVYNQRLVDDNTAYAFTQKEGYFYGIMPVRELLNSRPNMLSPNEWKRGIQMRERLGFGVLDNLGLMIIRFD